MKAFTTSAIVAAGLVLVAACGDDDTTENSDAASSGEMTIEVVTPGDGAEVGGSFELTVDPSVPVGEPDTGRHHVHVYYDGNTNEGEYSIVYGTSVTVEGLAPGEHSIEAAIANADHSLTNASAEITVTVGEAGAPSGEQPASTTIDYGY